MSTYEALALAVFSGLALLGAFSDLRSRTIPNALSGVLAVSGLAAVWLASGLGTAGFALLHLLAALAIGMALYALKMWGGGDGKFYAGTAAWFPISEMLSLILTISLAGLVLVIVWFGALRLRKGKPRPGSKREVPYGVAIAAGGIAAAAWRLF